MAGAAVTPRDRPPVWFERAIVPELIPEVAASVTILGPSAADPYAGLATAVGAVASTLRYDAVLMDHAPHLRLIARTGIGYDRVDVVEATKRGIAVCNTPEAPTISTAEHAATLMLMVAKSVKRAEAQLREGRGDYYARHEAIELEGKTIGLVGLGRIARRVARIGEGLGMQVAAFDPFLRETDFPPSVAWTASLADLLGMADVISLHLPLSDATRGMIGAAQFAQMKRGGVFINTARGGLVDDDALLGALDAGRLFGAGLDVTEPEPLPPDHPLLHRDDVVVTPHVASGTAEGKARIFRAAFGQVVQGLAGQRPDHLVNPEVWDGRTAPARQEG
jgi:phosphoglycerate dehydrogenase-like enzyme